MRVRETWNLHADKPVKVPPTASALVREALRRFLDDVARQEGTLPPAAGSARPNR